MDVRKVAFATKKVGVNRWIEKYKNRRGDGRGGYLFAEKEVGCSVPHSVPRGFVRWFVLRSFDLVSHQCPMNDRRKKRTSG
jgi:hypothetical protein